MVGNAVASGYTDGDGGAFVDGGFLSGDRGAFDACGRLTLVGRVSSFVNVAGRKVQPDEVERVLRAMPGVDDVRVVAAADARRGQQLVACIVPRRDDHAARRATVLREAAGAAQDSARRRFSGRDTDDCARQDGSGRARPHRR